MAITSSINFLPPVFRSVTNQRFVGATLDQLITDATNVPVNGYIGRTFAPTYQLGDNYVPESTTQRQHYQLEPSVVVKDSNNNIVLNSGYVDLLQGVANNGGLNNNHQRLFESTYYNYDGHFDYDKFVNYSNYYWLPAGPDPVTVSSGATPLTANYTVTRNTAVGGYTFSGLGGHPDTQITLARGGAYTFKVDQPGYKFWIQSEPGVTGTDANIPTINTRQVFGVGNNGTDSGTIQFNVPLATAQDFYILMPTNATVSAAVSFKYADIQNALLSKFLENFPTGLDGIISGLQNKTFIFVNCDFNDDNLWDTPGILDNTGFDSGVLSGTVPQDQRQSVWQINLVSNGTGDYIIQITPTIAVASQQKIFVGSGQTYASTEFWFTPNRQYFPVPLITANADYLYYQDSSNPDFVGQIKLVDNTSTPINVTADIVGKSSYTAPNGVIFTNGLKVQFDSLVVPAAYANNQYYVEGVGTSIALVPVNQLVVPESFAEQIETAPDYITINRASQDLNAWSRSNRWFHVDVLEATAKYNQTAVNYGPGIPGRRAIIEFEPNLQLFDFGRQAKSNVDLITFDSTDAFADIEGQISYTLDGTLLTQGMRVLFTNDYDTTITNKVWQVNFVTINNQQFLQLLETADDPVVAGQNVLVTQGVHAGQTFYYNGSNWNSSQEKTALNQSPLFDLVDADGYSFSDTTVYPASSFAGTRFFGYEVGTGTNDVVLGFPLTYQNFNNIGDIVFSNHYDTDTFTYAGATNPVNCNVGYLVKNTGLTSSIKLNNWVAGVEPTEQHQVITKFYEGRFLPIESTEATYPINLTVPAGNYAFVQIDVLPNASATIPYVKVYQNNQLLEAGIDYAILPYGVYYVVAFLVTPTVGDKLDVLIFSNTVSSMGYYEVPENLDYNPLNQNFETITLGQVRNHYNKLIENTSVNSANPIPYQDRYLKTQGGTLLQHSSPTIYGMTFLNDPVVNFNNGITLARTEYQRFKNKFLSLASSLKGLDYADPVASTDAILANINSVKNSTFSWYYSDMVPQGSNYSTINYTVLNARQTSYEINSIFSVTKLSNRAVLVYHNGVQLIANNQDFYYSQTSPEVVINVPLTVGDTITIREYANTDGNYVPETPTKLGLYQHYPPAIYVDTTYLVPTTVIRGHDGSITPAFGDFRDEFLLELEKRIYNNRKVEYNTLTIIDLYDTIPGRFRTTDYSLAEWNQLLLKNFLLWVGANNVDYSTNSNFDASNPWTWNYDQFVGIDGNYLQGSWRAIYNYWFDTDQPHVAPWNMLGMAEMPAWWRTRYGPAPYTNGNTTLWEDLEQGYVWNGSDSAAYYDTRFARPGLSGTLTGTKGFIPVDSAGNLLPPTQINIIKTFNQASASNNFQVGEQGPAETAWRRSSDFPYAIQQAMAVARPAEYFSTQIDLSRFYKNPVTGQFSNDKNQKISPDLLVVNGDTATEPGTVLRTAGYLNWIADYVKNLGIDPVAKIEEYFGNLTVQLAYKVGAFTDKNLITVTAEQTSPGSTNSSIIIPTDNYDFYINKSIPFTSITYSAVVVTKTDGGYAVSGYDTTNPFFTIIPSVANNQASTVTIDSVSVKVYETGSNYLSVIPYGTTFATLQQVSDFLVSYQRYLVSQGFEFEVFDTDLQTTRNWILSVQEFLTWAQQGWATGTILVLNPVFDTLNVTTVGSIIDEVTNSPNGSRLLNTNFSPIKSNNFNILRRDNPLNTTQNQFQLTTLDGQTGIALAKLNLIQYETTLIFDNIDDFGDIVYVPAQGTRQFRLKLRGSKTGFWDGALSATGYIYSNPTISNWKPNTDYKQGDIVTYNNAYYTAPADIVASSKFALSSWTQIALSDIQTGLLPSFGHNAQIFQNIYDVDNPPQDTAFQMFSAGLLGFRERPFLSNLGLTVPTQTKFYQGYIKQKGTINAINALTHSTFNTVNSTVSTYEEWGFRVGNYGDVSGNPYTEFVLDQSVFQTSPVAFTLTTNAAAYSTANIIVNLAVTGNTLTSNVYNASNIYSTTTQLYNNRGNVAYPTDLPSSGYVNTNDVDYQLYDITNIASLPNLAVANTIWTAKNFNGIWDVYRVSSTGLTATTLNYTLDSYAQLVFGNTHSFNVGDAFVLQGFNSNYKYDGLYQVVSVPSSTSVTVTISDTETIIGAGGSITGNGTVYELFSSRISSSNSLPTPPGGWLAGDRLWVDVDAEPGATGWAVLTYDGSNWIRTRQQQPQVDISSINSMFIYNKSNNVIIAALDFVDPIKGKVLNAFGNDIDYQLTQDPAYYNNGNVVVNPTLTIRPDFHWGPEQVGKIWWDVSAVSYIDYEQDTLIYRLNSWGKAFSGSGILIYEWVESPVPPSQYVAMVKDGVPLYADNSAYSTFGYVDQSGAVQTKYYFWVLGKTTVAHGNSNSVFNITAAIINPQAQGIPYATVLRDDTIALYNVNTLLTGKNSVLHLSTASATSGLIHTEYALVQEGNPESKIPAIIERKLVDSLAGQDSAGNAVPDPALTPAQAYGIHIRPRQSMFMNRALALSNYITFANDNLITYPVIENKLLTTLNSSEPTPNPNAGAYSLVVATYAELSYVDTTLISSGYQVLVESDSNNSGKWAIYTWNTPTANAWNLSRVQSYKTNLYWSFADWYETGYDHTVAPNVTVADKLAYGKLTLTANTYVKVLNNGNNRFVVYYIDSNLKQNTVGIQNGTIQISTGTIPALEMRQIALAMQNDIFVGDLASIYNQLFFTMVKYALSEQKNIDWAFKTSFLSATQYIRALAQFPSYIADNQQYYLDYINEVKPYRTTVREFVVDYQGNDQFSGDTTDFDLPPYWDANLQIYRSPTGNQSYDVNLLSSANSVYSQWYNNYTYSIVDVVIEQPGTGFTIVPQISFVGGGGTGATGYATLNGQGGIGRIIITNPGKGYTSTPTVLISGAGTGALAYPVLENVFDGNNIGHNLIRSIQTTMKFDRINYTNANTFVFWSNITSANIGETIAANTIIVNNNNLYVLANAYTIDANVDFPVANVTTITYSSLSNANDRITAFSGNVNLDLTQSGLSYPGVIVDGNTFVGNVFNSSIESFYSNVFGVNPGDVTIDGGKYVSTFASYAPEELVPGRMFDSVDFTVYDTNALAFRLFENMLGNTTAYRIASANITTLRANLNITDSNISVVNASVLPLPNPSQNTPGVVIINGEKITYWRNYALETQTPWVANLLVNTGTLISYSSNAYITTGNVFDSGGTFANIFANVTQITNINTLAQIRRGVDGTYTPAVQATGSRVVDASVQQIIPNSAITTTQLSANVTYQISTAVSYGLVLISNLSVNGGDIITQVNSTSNVVISTMRVLETVANTTVIPVIVLSGTVQGVPVLFDNPGFDENGDDIGHTVGAGFDNVVSSVYVNGINTNVYVSNIYILGNPENLPTLISNVGTIPVSSGTVVGQGNVWYTPGSATPSAGNGLINSTTPQAEFLKASPGFTPTPGTTP